MPTTHSHQLDDSDADWGTIPTSTRSSGTTTIFPRQVFHGLATLLLVSMCLLLVELNSPGVASRISGALFHHSPATVAISSKGYYSPVPAPFLTPKASRSVEMTPEAEVSHTYSREDFMKLDVAAPSSEPTHYEDRMGRFMVIEPTSEPTEHRERSESSMKLNVHASALQANDGPTEEPTIFEKDTFQNAGEPTNEPTIFLKDTLQNAGEPTNEPTIFLKDTLQNAGEPTNEPTIFLKDTLQNAGEPTNEPTVFLKDTLQNAGGPTNEPTIFMKDTFQNAGEPTNEPTIFAKDTFQDAGEPTYEPTVFTLTGDNGQPGEDKYAEAHQPTNEPTKKPSHPANWVKPVHDPTESPTKEPSQPPAIQTWAPTGVSVSVLPTSDPTIFPTPEPTPAI